MGPWIQESCVKLGVFEGHVRESEEKLDREDLDILSNRGYIVFLHYLPKTFLDEKDNIFLASLLRSLFTVSWSVDLGVQELNHD